MQPPKDLQRPPLHAEEVCGQDLAGGLGLVDAREYRPEPEFHEQRGQHHPVLRCAWHSRQHRGAGLARRDRQRDRRGGAPRADPRGTVEQSRDAHHDHQEREPGHFPFRPPGCRPRRPEPPPPEGGRLRPGGGPLQPEPRGHRGPRGGRAGHPPPDHHRQDVDLRHPVPRPGLRAGRRQGARRHVLARAELRPHQRPCQQELRARRRLPLLRHALRAAAVWALRPARARRGVRQDVR
mmetsp:Transcript_89863/g.279664  ORF Transcript_89863/g.279664 Transcript_89863/m.279664 type:complete len:237 (+) Transcript_89863:150-860(+)